MRVDRLRHVEDGKVLQRAFEKRRRYLKYKQLVLAFHARTYKGAGTCVVVLSPAPENSHYWTDPESLSSWSDSRSFAGSEKETDRLVSGENFIFQLSL